MDNSVLNDQYNNPQFWEAYGLTSDYVERLELILQLLPKNVRSLLDIGCGKGEIIDTILQGNSRIYPVGLETTREPLSFVRSPRLVGALPNTPFANNSFDLVLCLQVLEHIHFQQYEESLREIERLAGNYIIIGVPFRENLQEKMTTCNQCQQKSHADGHLRAYDFSDMVDLFEHFKLISYFLTGKLIHREDQASMWIAQNIAGDFYRPEIFNCPYCGSRHTLLKERPFPARFTARFLISMLNRVTLSRSSAPYWIIAIYQKAH